MMELILLIKNFIESASPLKLIITSTLVFGMPLLLIYLVTVIESYSYYGVLEVLKYTKYDVTVHSNNKGTANSEIISVRAWGRIHAVEKVAKKTGDKLSFTFEVEKAQ